MLKHLSSAFSPVFKGTLQWVKHFIKILNWLHGDWYHKYNNVCVINFEQMCLQSTFEHF